MSKTRNRRMLLALVAAAACNSCRAGDIQCSDVCGPAGSFTCAGAPEQGLTVCADFDQDGCLEWGGFFSCGAEEVCAEGDCVAVCQDDCPGAGERDCSGDGYVECGQHDDDACLEWGEPVPCQAGESCSGGACSSGCSDECAEGEKECVGEGLRTCGQHDGDACRDWSAVQGCGGDEYCDRGACVPRQCLDEGEDCVCGENQCCEGHCCPVFFICVSWPPDKDYCL